jgi:hypothetical protein
MSNFINYLFNFGWTHWLVTYAHSSGFGTQTIKCNSWYLDFLQAQEALKKQEKDDQIVVLSFQRITKHQFKARAK